MDILRAGADPSYQPGRQGGVIGNAGTGLAGSSTSVRAGHEPRFASEVSTD
jgi:hypothetical protein